MQGKRPFSFVWLALLLCFFTGCARIQYRLVEPAEHAQLIGPDAVRFPYPPLEYRLVRYDDRLIIRISNPAESAVKLMGNSSYLVDPAKKTHPLREGVVAPQSYIELYLPPVPLNYETPTDLALSFGVGAVYDSPVYRHQSFGFGFGYPYSSYRDPLFYRRPLQSYQVIIPSDWQWKAGEVSLRLVWDLQGNNFDHDFVFLRTKAK